MLAYMNAAAVDYVGAMMIHVFSCCWVHPTYCSLHLAQVIR